MNSPQSTNRRDFLANSALGTGVLASGLLAAGPTGSRIVAADETPARAPAGRAAAAGDVPLAPPDKQPPNLKLPEVVTKNVGWAIVGLGQLALEEILPAFAEAKYAKPAALVSGHADKAKQVAAAYDIDSKSIYNYENYDQIAENKDVDVIYIVLPNSMHAEYTIRGFKAGKHVLCEKPMAASVEECQRMIEAGRAAKKQLMIAYRLRYEPFNKKAIEICREELGPIKTFAAGNGQDVKAPNIRLSAKLAGGPVGDVGVYCLNAARYCLGEEPIEVSAMEHWPKDDPRFREVPESVAFTLRFPSGAIAHCDCSFGSAENRFYRVLGTKGHIEMSPAFSYNSLQLSQTDETGTKRLKFKEVNHFAAEMDHFSECVLSDKDCRTPGEEGLADMRVIEAIHEAAKTGKTVRV